MSDTETTQDLQGEEAVSDSAEQTTETEESSIDIENLSQVDMANLSDEDLAKLQDQPTSEEEETDETDQVDSEEEGEEGNQPPKNQQGEDSENRTDAERIAELEKQLSVLQKKSDDRGNFIEKQKSMINGLLKKVDTLKLKKADLDNKTSDQGFWDNPNEALKAREEKTEVESQLADAQKELHYRQNRQSIEQVVPDYKDLVDDIVDYLKEVDPAREVEIDGEKRMVGTTDEVIEQFKKDPFIIPASSAINFVNGARMFKSNKLLQEKNEIMSKKPRKILDKVNQAANHRTATSAPGATTKRSTLDASQADLARMSDKELAEYTNQIEQQLGR